MPAAIDRGGEVSGQRREIGAPTNEGQFSAPRLRIRSGVQGQLLSSERKQAGRHEQATAEYASTWRMPATTLPWGTGGAGSRGCVWLAFPATATELPPATGSWHSQDLARYSEIMRFALHRFALVALLASPLAAQEAPALRGTVRDSLGRPMAKVQVSHRSATTLSDSLGNFRLTPVPTGRITVRFVRDGILLGTTIADVTADTTDGVSVEVVGDTTYPRTLVGKVVDSTGAPIRDATVDVVTALVEMRTDSLGRFAFRNLPPRRHIVRVRRVGFAPSYASADLSDGSAARLRITVRQFAGQNLGLVVVRSTRVLPHLRGFMQRAAKPSGWERIITAEEIAIRNPQRPSDILRGIAGVQLNFDPRGQATVTGRGGCVLALFINGFPAPQQANMGIDSMISTLDLAGVEVFNGIAGVPGELLMGGPNSCGTLALWTK
jgi:Carboxypeptidase regulatory-like domain/TonB-dependent Receptor Plug Domain